MKIVKRIVLALVAIVVVLVAVAYALPSHYSVARSIDIDAPPSKIYPLVANTRAWKQWSAWNRRDPNMQISTQAPSRARARSGSGTARVKAMAR